MCDDVIAATVMLGLVGFRVLAVSEYAGEVEQAVETTAEQGWCPTCGAAARLHNRRPTWVRDLPAAGRPVTLVSVKRIWRCHEPLCPQVTWTETHDEIRARACMTERARREACRRVGQDGHTVAAVAADFGVGWATIMDCVREYGTPLVDDPTGCWTRSMSSSSASTPSTRFDVESNSRPWATAAANTTRCSRSVGYCAAGPNTTAHTPGPGC